MQAMVFQPSGEVLTEVPDPRPEADEVLVEVAYCGICGSDLHAAGPNYRAGCTMGHEFSGTVVEAGAEVTGVTVGDRVVINPNGDVCGQCPPCRRGAPHTCVRLDDNAIGLARGGGLAPYAAVRARAAHVLPEGLDLRTAAWTEPLAVALRTVRRSGFAVGQDAVVFGGGPIGLLVTALLGIAGAAAVTVVEPSATRRDMALHLGATRVLDPTATPAREVFADPLSAPGFAFECSGVAELVGEAAAVLRPEGTLTVTGYSRRPPSFDAADLLFKELTIRGTFIYTTEFVEAIGVLAAGRVDVASLTSGVVPVADAATAFAAMRTSPDAVKYLVGDQSVDG